MSTNANNSHKLLLCVKQKWPARARILKKRKDQKSNKRASDILEVELYEQTLGTTRNYALRKTNEFPTRKMILQLSAAILLALSASAVESTNGTSIGGLDGSVSIAAADTDATNEKASDILLQAGSSTNVIGGSGGNFFAFAGGAAAGKLHSFVRFPVPPICFSSLLLLSPSLKTLTVSTLKGS